MSMTFDEFCGASFLGIMFAVAFLFVTSENFNKKPHVYRSGVSALSMDA